MSYNLANMERLDQTLRVAGPAHRQSTYRCNSAKCAAGWTTQLFGEWVIPDPEMAPEHGEYEDLAAFVRLTPEEAEQVRDAEWSENYGVHIAHCHEYAEWKLGLGYCEANMLFFSSDSGFWRIWEEILQTARNEQARPL